MNRQFYHTHTVRYDECDNYGYLTPAAFLRYMQEIASLDAEDIQLEGDGYWIVKRTVISFAAPIKIHTKLDLKTFGMGFTRITAQRGYAAYLAGEPHDTPVVSARTLWVYVDKRGRPTRMPQGTAQIWLPDGPQPQQPEAPLPTFPEGEPHHYEATVRFSDTDLMQHMNNAAYVEALDNAAWEAYAQAGITPDKAMPQIRSYDIEYAESIRFGEQFAIQSWFDPWPTAGEEFSRLQRITRNGTVAVRAHSRWLWHAQEL